MTIYKYLGNLYVLKVSPSAQHEGLSCVKYEHHSIRENFETLGDIDFELNRREHTGSGKQSKYCKNMTNTIWSMVNNTEYNDTNEWDCHYIARLKAHRYSIMDFKSNYYYSFSFAEMWYALLISTIATGIIGVIHDWLIIYYDTAQRTREPKFRRTVSCLLLVFDLWLLVVIWITVAFSIFGLYGVHYDVNQLKLDDSKYDCKCKCYFYYYAGDLFKFIYASVAVILGILKIKYELEITRNDAWRFNLLNNSKYRVPYQMISTINRRHATALNTDIYDPMADIHSKIQAIHISRCEGEEYLDLKLEIEEQVEAPLLKQKHEDKQVTFLDQGQDKQTVQNTFNSEVIRRKTTMRDKNKDSNSHCICRARFCIRDYLMIIGARNFKYVVLFWLLSNILDVWCSVVFAIHKSNRAHRSKDTLNWLFTMAICSAITAKVFQLGCFSLYAYTYFKKKWYISCVLVILVCLAYLSVFIVGHTTTYL